MWDFADVYKRDQFAFSYLTLHEWNYKQLKGKNLKSFLEKYNYNKVILYSLGTLGSYFAQELIKENVEILCILDDNSAQLPSDFMGVPVIAPDALTEYLDFDAIIICHVYYYNKIADKLVSCGVPEDKIISLNDIVFSI